MDTCPALMFGAASIIVFLDPAKSISFLEGHYLMNDIRLFNETTGWARPMKVWAFFMRMYEG